MVLLFFFRFRRYSEANGLFEPLKVLRTLIAFGAKEQRGLSIVNYQLNKFPPLSLRTVEQGSK